MSRPQRVIKAAAKYLSDLWDRREFAWYLAMGNLKARNASTTLGLLWWVLNPLLLGAVYFTVFGLIIDRSDLEGGLGFLPFLLSGIFPFYFTQSSMTGGVNSIVSNTKLLTNLHFPRAILPISALMESFVGFMASLFVFFVVVGPVEGIWPSARTLWLIPIVVIHTLFNFGLSTLVARIAVQFRDLNNLVPYMTRLWLYLSPILYPPSMVAERGEPLTTLYSFNPLVPILRMYRYALTGLSADVSSTLLIAGFWAIVIAGFGATTFIRREGRIARYL